ncbi:MAG TPA: M56 family metallopeptidase [Gemmatimonadaceae bacterium]|nr:M56 family metallopeptidase [Gemmatimonadaceae bacterium]
MSALAFGIAVSVRVTILLVAVAGCAMFFRKRSAALQHALWVSAIIASLAVPLSSFVLSKAGAAALVKDVSPAWTMVAASLGKDQPRSSVPVPTPEVRGRLPSLTSIAMARMLNGEPAEFGPLSSIETVATALWLAVFLIFLVRIIASAIAVESLRRRAHAIADSRLLSMATQISGADSTLLVVESSEITAPATAGILRPIILLPIGAREWPVDRVRATFAHEYAHVQRRDCLIQLVADIARAVYWFNPLVWYARRRMIIERERACDDLVIGKGIQPDNYATVLVDTVRGSLTRPGTIAFGTLAMARPSELETRLVSILDPGRTRTGISRLTTTSIALIVAVATILLGASRVQAAAAQSLLEPDLRDDSVAGPLSEKLPLAPWVYATAERSSALTGPDSIVARKLHAQLDRRPRWYGDLVRDRSAWALSIARDGQLIPPLLDALLDSDWRVRAYAAWALGVAQEPRALDRLVQLLKDPNWRMRAMAADALESIASPSVAGQMEKALHDEAWQVRSAAVSYFGAINDARYQPVLLTALRDRHMAVQSAAVRALSQLTTTR